MVSEHTAIDLSKLGFRVETLAGIEHWGRPVSNRRSLFVGGLGCRRVADLRDGKLTVLLYDTDGWGDRIYARWDRQSVADLRSIIVDVDSNVAPLNLHSPGGALLVCRLVTLGDRHGVNGRYVLEGNDSALIEFYDARYQESPYGQFVGVSYVLSDFLKHQGDLLLNPAVPEWVVDASSVARVQQWAADAIAQFSPDVRRGLLAQVRRAFADKRADDLPVGAEQALGTRTESRRLSISAKRRKAPGLSM